MTSKKVLVLADNARDAAQARPLLPPPGCLLLVTSRTRFTLPGLKAINLDCLAEPEAVELLEKNLPADRRAGDGDRPKMRAAAAGPPRRQLALQVR